MPPQNSHRRLAASSKKLSIGDSIEQLIKNARQYQEHRVDVRTVASLLPQTRVTPNQDSTGLIDIPLILPKIWDETPYLLRASMYQLTLSQLEIDEGFELVPFVVRISENLYARAMSSDNPANYVSRKFREYVGVDDYWFGFELAGKKQHPHIQGGMLVHPSCIKAARKSLYRMNACNDPAFIQASVRFRTNERPKLIQQRGRLAVDLNWASYNMKEGSRVAVFGGIQNPTQVSSSLRRKTKCVYESLRAIHRNPLEVTLQELHQPAPQHRTVRKTNEKFGSW